MPDWIFAGWEPPLRTIVVGIASYLGLVLVLRVSGKRTLSQLNAFDFVVTVALGSTSRRPSIPELFIVSARPAGRDALAALTPAGDGGTPGGFAADSYTKQVLVYDHRRLVPNSH